MWQILAERVGFEPTVTARATTVFETAPIVHSGTSPSKPPNYSRGQSKFPEPALLHKNSYFRKHDCVNKNVTLQRRKKAAEGTYDDNTKQERIIESNAPTLSKSQQDTKNTDTG